MYIEASICEYLREEIFPQIAPPPYGDIEIISLGAWGAPIFSTT